MAPQDEHGSGSKPAKPRSGRHRIKSSLFRQPPLASDAYDDDPIFTTIFPNSDWLSTSNPSGPLPTNSTNLSSDSNISFRRERLGLYVQNYAPPPEPQYKGLQAAHKEPQPKLGPKPVDWGAWNVPEPKTNNSDDDAKAVLWGGAPMDDNSVQWAPTSGKRSKKKNKGKGNLSQGHFLEPPVSTIKVDILQKCVKWRTSPINGGSGTGAVDGQTKFVPWDAPKTDRGLNSTDTEMVDANVSSVANNAEGINAHDSHRLITQPRPGFYYLEQPRKPFVLEVSDDEEEQTADNEDEKQSAWDITV